VTNGDEVPAIDPMLDWECELAAVVGTSLAGVDADEALAGIMGYAPFNDISARTYQRHTHQWTPGKNMDRSGVIGTIVTSDEVGDPNAGLRIESRLNGQTMQSSTTDLMLFSVGMIASYLSEIMTLEPGDIIVTGTPEGVGHARNPPLFMKAGDVIEVEIEKVGKIANPIVASTREARSGDA
jgi:2,4-diketo-3-deoxy-L-fuconate hydrolase